MKILVAMPRGDVRASFIPPGVAAEIEELGEVDWNEGVEQLSPRELGERLRGVDVCFTGWGCACFTREVLSGAENLRVIAHTGGSVGTLVDEAAYARGIHVISGNEIYAKSVAEGVIAYALASLRGIPRFAAHMLREGWQPQEWQSEGLFGQTVGLVGFGAVARHLVPLLHAFEMDIKVYADHVTPEEEARYGITKTTLEDVCSTCKIISLHTSATPEYHHMIDEGMLSLIPDGALLINTARGMVMDEAALARHAATGRFRVMLDVYEKEPLPTDSPLRHMDNVLMIPHMAGPTTDRRPYVTRALIGDVRAVMSGKLPALAISLEQARRMTRDT